MGQCTSCGSTRLDNSSVPNSPSVEFNPTDLFENTPLEQKCHPPFQNRNLKRGSRPVPLFVSINGGAFEPNRKLFLGTRFRPGATRSDQFPANFFPSPRRKLKTVTFSEPIVRTFEPSRKLQFPFSKIRLTSKPKRPSLVPTPDLKKLTVTSFEVNGKEFCETQLGEEESGMGNSTSSKTGESKKFSCVNIEGVRPSTFPSNSQSLKESPSCLSSSSLSPLSSEQSKSETVSQCHSSDFSSSQNGVSLTNLDDLEEKRKQRQLLRDRFFSGEPSLASTPVQTSDADMNSNFSNGNGRKGSSPNFQQANKLEKMRRTFQYRSTSATAPTTPISPNTNELPKLYSTQQAGGDTTDFSPLPSTNFRTQSASAIGGSSRIPGIKSRASTTSIPRNVNMNRTSNADTPTRSTGFNKDTQPGAGIRESFRKSATFDGNINNGVHGGNPRRESAPLPRCLPQRKYTNSPSMTRIYPTKTPNGIQRIGSAEVNDNQAGRRISLFGLSNKLTPENAGLKRPVESKPFYTIGLYQFKSPRPIGNEFPPTIPSQPVNTGVVTQRKLLYQTQTSDPGLGIGILTPQSQGRLTPSPKPAQPTPTTNFGLNRSATWVRGANGEIRPDKENSGSPSAMSNSAPSHPTIKTNQKGKDSENAVPPVAEKQNTEPQRNMRSRTPANYPLEHANSTASTSSILEGHCGDANVISDSEFLIDDEISDQPELTLTFKDSPLRLSRSSSGESLLSCDLMLDHSLKESICPGEHEVTSDSAISDVSSSIPTSLGSANSNGHTKNSIPLRRTNRIPSPFSSTPTSSKPNARPGFRNSTASSGIPNSQNQQNETPKNRSPSKTPERKPAFQSELKSSTSSVNRSPTHSAKFYSRLPSNRNNSLRLNQNLNGCTESERFNSGDLPSQQLVINDVCEDILILRQQLEVLKGILVEQEIIHTEKDETIEILKKEIEMLKKKNGGKFHFSGESGQGDKIENISGNTKLEKGGRKYSGDEVESKTNAASQTDSTHRNSDLVHPHELNGRLVSFWIGRRSYSSYNSAITYAT